MPTRREDHVRRLPGREQVDTFLMLLKQGHYVRTACDYSDISERSCYEWLREGTQTDGRPWCQEFARNVRQARSFAQAAALQVVTKAAQNGTWQAAAWFLERSNPSQWALQRRHEIDLNITTQPVSARTRLNAVLDELRDELDVEDAEVVALPLADGA